MRVMDRANDWQQRANRVAASRRSAVESFRKTATLDIFQRKKHPPADFADLEQLHDVRMLQSRDGLGFGEEPRAVGVASVIAGENHLQGHQASEFFLFGQ